MSCNQKKWGPHVWEYLHSATLSYSNKPSIEEQNAIKNLIMGLEYTLPCTDCRNNFKKHISNTPLSDSILLSKNKLIKWLIDLHNSINVELGKPVRKYNDMILLHELRCGCKRSEAADKYRNKIIDKIKKMEDNNICKLVDNDVHIYKLSDINQNKFETIETINLNDLIIRMIEEKYK
jgi:hypothetical protein